MAATLPCIQHLHRIEPSSSDRRFTLKLMGYGIDEPYSAFHMDIGMDTAFYKYIRKL
jgi:hypothetical protein